jgi:hypothetical protein
MTAIGQRTASIPMAVGGMFSAGDPSTQPDGTTRALRNYLIRPNRFDGRPPFVYDSLMNVKDLLRWEDLTNQLTRTIAIDTTPTLKIKALSGIAYQSDAIAGSPSGRLTDFANFLGKVYQVFDDGAGVPNGSAVWDGLTVSTTPFNSTIYARCVTAFIERLFLAYPRVTITPNTGSVIADAYDWTNTARWVATNVNINNVTISSGVTVCRLSPTSTAASGCSIRSRTAATTPEAGIISLTASSSEAFELWRCDARGTDPLYDVPVTLELMLWTFKQDSTAYNVGDLLVSTAADGNTYRYRCKVAGTTGVGVVLGSTKGATTADNTVTWLNDGSNVLAATEGTVPNISSTPDGVTLFVLAPIPPHTNTLTVTPRIKFYNTANPALTTLAPIDISLKDGVADGDLRKANRGQQWTAGDFYYPFFNCETATTATVNLDAIVWSEINNPKAIRAKNTFSLVEIAGLPTAAAVACGGRYIVFKRRGMWVFTRTSDKNIPILTERPSSVEIGCLGPRALDTWGDDLFWIGENGVYRMSAGGDPKEICGTGMREEIMAHGSTWAETQSTYNQPFLVVDHANQEVWVYTQKSKIYIYHIPSEQWSYIDCPNSSQVRTMLFDYIGQRMLVSFGGFGATRFMEASSAKDSIDNTVTTYSITNDVIFKPLELYAPRYEAALEEVGIFHLATASQSGETIEVAYSLDRGSTWNTPTGYPGTVDISRPRVRLAIVTVGPSVMVRVRRIGSGGAAKWAISKADATLQVKRGELPYANVA